MVALCLLSRPAAAQAPPGHGSPPAAGEDGDGPSLMLVRLLVNGQAQEGEILAGRRGDAWFLKAADLERWKIRPDAPPVTIDGEALVPLPSFITPSFDAASQQLDLTVPAERFAVQRLSGSAGRLLPTAGTFAAFLNYDLSVSHQDELASSAFLEAGLSDDWGLFANSMTVGQSSGIGNGVVRLDSYFIRDDPQDLRRLILGDTVTTSPTGAARYAMAAFATAPNSDSVPPSSPFPPPPFSAAPPCPPMSNCS
jgi:outer membrane usher protein